MGLASIDIGTFTTFQRMMESEFSEVLENYIQVVPDALQAIQAAASVKDVYTVQLEAHSLKSSLRQLGALELADLAKTLEEKAKSNSLDGVAATVTVMQQAWSEIAASLQVDNA